MTNQRKTFYPRPVVEHMWSIAKDAREMFCSFCHFRKYLATTTTTMAYVLEESD